MFNATITYFKEADDDQPGIQDVVRYNFKKSKPDHDCADVIICYYNGRYYHPIASCFVTLDKNSFTAEFSPKNDPLKHPASVHQYFDTRRGMDLIRDHIYAYFTNLKKQF